MRALAVVKPPKGARLRDTLTRWVYKEVKKLRQVNDHAKLSASCSLCSVKS
jgi:hypothetical protein